MTPGVIRESTLTQAAATVVQGVAFKGTFSPNRAADTFSLGLPLHPTEVVAAYFSTGNLRRLPTTDRGEALRGFALHFVRPVRSNGDVHSDIVAYSATALGGGGQAGSSLAVRLNTPSSFAHESFRTKEDSGLSVIKKRKALVRYYLVPEEPSEIDPLSQSSRMNGLGDYLIDEAPLVLARGHVKFKLLAGTDGQGRNPLAGRAPIGNGSLSDLGTVELAELIRKDGLRQINYIDFVLNSLTDGPWRDATGWTISVLSSRP